MLWLIIIPVGFILIVVIVAILLGKRDDKKEAKKREEKQQNLLISNPKQAVLEKINSIKHISEYALLDVHVHKANIDCLYISKKGIFLIYVIGKEGTIAGEMNKEYWVNKHGEDFALVDPLYNNERDLEVIEDITNERVHLYSLVICTCIDEISLIGNENNVIKIDELEKVLENYPEVISPDDLVILYNNVINTSDED